MLPQIPTHAKIAFAHLTPEARSEAVQNVCANACRGYARLVEQGKTDIAYPMAPARYGVMQTRDHSRVRGHLNIQDVLSRYCQVKKNVVVERLDKFDHAENVWEEVLVEDRHAGPADTAHVRLDFSDWLVQGTAERQFPDLGGMPSRGVAAGRHVGSGPNHSYPARPWHATLARTQKLHGL